jgi:hypothetical protein
MRSVGAAREFVWACGVPTVAREDTRNSPTRGDSLSIGITVRVGIVKLFGNACGAVDVSASARRRCWLTARFKPLRR